MNYSDHYDHAQLRMAFSQMALKKHLAYFEDILRTRLIDKPHGDLSRWQNALNALPEQACELLCLDHITVKATDDQNATTDNEQLRQTLMGLHPWRKGPFQFFDVTVDTEWHSDWKWQRVLPHLSDLHNRRVLDVGGGNGYHAWRMFGVGARLVVNIDPSPLFYHQFHAVKRYHTEAPVFQLPMTLEQMPNELQCFDTVFSMGVLYHRKSPIEHLEQLKMMLKVGGELVLETLVIDGDEQQLLLPENRYAQMNNVY
ncbi:MAG: tRNA 5-methoxyuridine(34)/uridine 5-oxyacetic acid(34) synthase CmoB, partial [Pseudomonadota bacterium]|nr:tRNA 5-methoxyuridine(34)/uridine 5-oxyacetic acid(34) synthase CmoB [Pseudomonadota bacterium]